MNTQFKLLFLLSIIIFIHQPTKAQKKQNDVFLQKLGIIDSLYSETLQESRKFFVHLPPTSDFTKSKKYPVAYILDGEHFLPTVANVQNYYSGGFTPEMVLIGIVNSENRTRDLTPSKITSKYGMPFNEPNGEANNFRKFIKEELIPYVEKKYPVTNYRTLIGHSYGGLFTVATLIEDSNLFNNYLAIDPSLDWDDQKLLKEAKEKVASAKFTNKSLFMSLSGQLHMQNSNITIKNVMKDTTDYTLFPRSNIAFSNLIKQNTTNELKYEWKFYPNDIHGTIPFPSIMDGLISIFKWYQMENTDKINSFETSKDELYAIIKNREEKLFNHFGYFEPPYPEELLNMSGYMNMEMQQLEKAKMYFELAIKYYPNSANAYDSMADYYEVKNDIKNAIKFVEKASKLSANDYYKNRIKELKTSKSHKK